MGWKESLQKKLCVDKKNRALCEKYINSFPSNYCEAYSFEQAAKDIAYLEKVSEENPLELILFRANPEDTHLHLKLFQWEKTISLSTILPYLDNLNLLVEREQAFPIKLKKQQTIWISDFIVYYQADNIDIAKQQDLFRETFIHAYTQAIENDGLNKLTLSAQLSSQQIIILRAYVKYLHQIGFQISQPLIETTLNKHPDLTRLLIDFFYARHQSSQTIKAAEKLEAQILSALEKVSSLDEDRVIRRLFQLIKATLRTNYFKQITDKKPLTYLSFKLESKAIPELPLPLPLYEIFVYATQFEGIHLRNSKIARGGIRWSDRREDFRTEILGLMKAQKVKNAVIVPSGAKGGFVLKNRNKFTTREALNQQVIQYYQSFIRGLLDLTDNIKDKKTIPPKQVVCHDDADPYLVVAADKGTATFSDIANQLANDYEFWLGDAFASGGKTGYDHKKMGITAKGAWESVKRHFRELAIDITQTPITVIGIGDMSGDVFGNGMLYNKNIKLLCAFDHRDIFIDPSPDLEKSYQERSRLFKLANSSWQDYNVALIAKGGGVFSRSLKSITLTKEMRDILGTDASALTPNDLIKTILKAPVDLLFNGGIGTYVKSSQESHFDVGDRSNDACRINGNELRCKVVGEGGNLGFTQLGRIEYAMAGGYINTDFIDNSAGVDCSDHEVNLKILLNQEVRKKKLSEENRNQLLTTLTPEIASLVLHDNYSQALVLSYSVFHSKKNLTLHTYYIKELETLGYINRQVESLPDEKKLLERKSAGEGLTRPELATLLAYSKIHLKQAILQSSLLKEDFFLELFLTAFPESIRKKFLSIVHEHPLYADITATQMANKIVNEMGITFIYRLHIETGASIANIIRAYTLASHIFASSALAKTIDALNHQIPLPTQYDMLQNLRNLINIATRWFLHSRYLNNNLQDTIEHFTKQVNSLEKIIPDLMSGYTKQYLDSLTSEFLKIGLSKDLAKRIATYRAIYTSLNIIHITTKYQFDLIKTAQIYFAAGEKMHLVWLRDQIAQDSRDGHWNVLARLSLRDELDLAQRSLTVAIMQAKSRAKNIKQLVSDWIHANEDHLARWEKLLEMIHTSTNIDYSMFFIALRELLIIISQSVEKESV